LGKKEGNGLPLPAASTFEDGLAALNAANLI
jgi:hypothetical protein